MTRAVLHARAAEVVGLAEMATHVRVALIASLGSYLKRFSKVVASCVRSRSASSLT